MIALVGAMFVALQSVSAAACVANPGITLGLGEDCELTYEDATAHQDAVSSSNEDVATVSTPDANGMVTVDAVAIGVTTITISDLGDDDAEGGVGDNADKQLAEFEVTVAGFALTKVAVKGDSDGTVSAGPQVTVQATLRSARANNSVVRLTVPTTGLSIQSVDDEGDPEDGTTQQQTKTVGTDGGTVTLEFIVNTAGAPAGEYKLTFVADNDDDFATTSAKPAPAPENEGDAAKATRLENSKQDSDTLILTVGDPGTGLASATLSLGNSVNDLPFTDKDETVAESGSDVAKATGDADGKINLVVEVFDSNGGKANSSAVNQIIVIAPGGSIEANRMNTATPPAPHPTEEGDSSLTLDEVGTDHPDVGQRTVVSVSKEDQKPGQVTVYAIVSGPGGAARTEDITLSFSGPATSLSVADASESLLSVNEIGDNPETDATEDDFVIQDTIKLLVTAEDEGGNSAVPPTGGVSIVITDPDGKRKGTSVIGRSQPTKDADGKYYITLTGMGSKAAPLAAGAWTVDITSGKLEAGAMFAVAGAASDVAVSASASSSDTIGDVITVTASVTDKDGNTVSNGTMVMFDVSEDTGLAAIGTGHAGKATKDGEASVKYAVVGAGHSVISATADDATGVIVIDSTAGAPDAMPEEAMGLSCLSALNAFSTYTCAQDSSASELFGLVSGRGATAIHLWNGTAWVRYSVVDGAMVPGSTDFPVSANETLYISY